MVYIGRQAYMAPRHPNPYMLVFKRQDIRNPAGEIYTVDGSIRTHRVYAQAGI